MARELSLELNEDLREPVYFLLMRSPEVYKKVENLYLAKEEHYKNILKEIHPTSHFFHGVQTNDKWNMLMLKAITKEMEEESEEKYEEFILELIKQSYKRIYDYAHRNPMYNQYLFAQYIEKREPNISENKNSLYSFLYLYIAKDLPNFKVANTPLDKMIFENIALMKNDVKNFEKQVQLTENEKKEALVVFQDITGVNWRNNEPKRLNEIFGDIEARVLDRNPHIKRKIAQTGNTRLSYHLKPLSYLRYALSNLNVFGYDNQLFLYGLVLTKEEWYRIYWLNQQAIKEKRHDITERNDFIMISLVQYAQHVAYQKLEDMLWQMKLNENVSELRSEQKALEDERLAWKNEKKVFEKEKSKLEEQTAQELARKDDEIDRLTKELEVLKKEKEKLVEQVEFMPLLQEAVFQRTQDGEIEETEETVELKDMIAGKQMVLVGGHDSFRKKMSEHFEGLYTLAPEEKNAGINQVKNAEIVLFDTGYNNHTQFERLKSVMTKEQVIVFLNDITSTKRVEQEILKRIKGNING